MEEVDKEEAEGMEEVDTEAEEATLITWYWT
jgi:hypothetical protein